MTATPAPWAADTPSLLTELLTHVAAARIVTAAGDTVELDLVDGRMSIDETRSPRYQASLTCRVPTDVAVLGRIDPRLGARLLVDVGYSRPDGTADVHTVADLALRTRNVTRPDNRMTLTAASDECLVIDAAYVATGQLTASNTLNAIATVIHQVLPSAAVSYTAAGGAAVDQQQADTDRWDTIQDLADQLEAQVYVDGARGWHIDVAPTLAGTPALTVADGARGTLIASEAGLDRDDWANWVVIRYRWTSTSGTQLGALGSQRITSGPYAATVGNTKIAYFQRETPSINSLATQAAAALVKRMVTRGRSLRITAPSAYWLTPGDTITVDLPTGDPEPALVSAVEFDLLSGLMDVTTRLPDNTGTIGA